MNFISGYCHQGSLGAERRRRCAYWEACWRDMVGQRRWHLMHWYSGLQDVRTKPCKLDVKQRRVQLRECDSSSDHLRRVSMAVGTLTTKVAAYASAQEGRPC